MMLQDSISYCFGPHKSALLTAWNLAALRFGRLAEDESLLKSSG